MTDAIKTSDWQKRHSLVLASFVAMFIAYLDRVNISVAAIAMQESLGWSETEKGLFVFVFSSVIWRAQIVGGCWLTSTVANAVMLWSLVAWSVFTMLTPIAASASFAMLILVRIGLGLGEAPLSPAVLSLLRTLDSGERALARGGHLFQCGDCRHHCALVITGFAVAKFGWQGDLLRFWGLGLLCLWLTTCHESPETHPRHLC